MVFKAVFSHCINDDEPAIIGPVSPEALWDYEFLIEAGSASEAERIARKYKGIEEERARKERIGMLEIKLFDVLEDLAQEYGMSSEDAKKFITTSMVKKIEEMIGGGKQKEK